MCKAPDTLHDKPIKPHIWDASMSNLGPIPQMMLQ